MIDWRWRAFWASWLLDSGGVLDSAGGHAGAAVRLSVALGLASAAVSDNTFESDGA